MRSIPAIVLFLSIAVLLFAISVGGASAVELLGAQIVGGGAPELQNGAGTVRILNPRLSGEIFVPEPDVSSLIGFGSVALVVMMTARRNRLSTDDSRRLGSILAGE